MTKTLLDRIIEGEHVPLHEILERNARLVIGRVQAFIKSPCMEAGGNRKCSKDCTHGQTIDTDLSFAAQLTEEANACKI